MRALCGARWPRIGLGGVDSGELQKPRDITFPTQRHDVDAAGEWDDVGNYTGGYVDSFLPLSEAASISSMRCWGTTMPGTLLLR